MATTPAQDDHTRSAGQEVADRLAAVVNGLPEIVFQLTVSADARRFTFISAGLQAAIGVTAQEAMRDADAVFNAIMPEDREGLLQSLARAAQPMRRWIHEFRFRHPSGAVRWVRGEALPERRPDGTLVWNGYWQDTTERKATEDALHRALREQQALLEATPSAIAVIRGSVIARCNRAMAQLFGYETGALAGQPLRTLYPDDAAWTHAEHNDRYTLARGRTVRREQEFCRSNGERFRALIAARSISADTREIVLSVTDITAQDEFARALADAKEAADAANRAKSGFLATVSHEIRTPMNAVLGMLELLGHTTLSPEQRDMLGDVQDSARTLLRLVNDILDFSRIEAGNIEIRSEAVSLEDLVHRCAAAHRERADARGVQLTTHVSADLAPAHVTDPIRILQVLNNLVGNALKFTASGGRIAIRLERTGDPGSSDRVRFSVTDSGIGISAKDQARLFEPFYQVTSTPRQPGVGVGLGLSICRRVVEAMGGRIALASEPGVGTAVSFDLELSHADAPAASVEHDRRRGPALAAAPSAVPPAPPPATGLRILVAEDHPASLKLLLMQIEMLGYAADGAGDGLEALRKWKTGAYHLLITDCQMPAMDGLELTREIRRIEATRPNAVRTPIIACTANAFDTQARQCIEAGMNDVLTKPMRLDTFREKIARYIPHEGAPGQPGAPAPAPAAPPAAPTLPLATEAPRFDLPSLGEFTGGDRKAERDILSHVLSANTDDLEKLEVSVRSGNREQIARAAHRLKGAPRMIGAKPLADAAERVERAAQGEGAIEESMARLRDVNMAFRAYIAQRLAA